LAVKNFDFYRKAIIFTTKNALMGYTMFS